jgi:nudix-type nucleoside diphosphatase (YffH/AdpP family)
MARKTASRNKATKVNSIKVSRKAASSAKVLNSRVVFRSPVFYLTSERVREPSGVTVRRDVVRHPGSVVVMAVDETDERWRVLLIRQFRYAAGRELWELPAGRIDEGEEALSAARRELLEETGITAKRWKKAISFFSSPGFLDETMELFLARGLKQGEAQPEEDEVIRARFFPISLAVKMVMSGKIADAKTIVGVLWLEKFLSRI